MAAIVIPLFAVSAWIASHQYREQREALSEGLLGVAHALSAAVDRELAIGETMASALTHSPLLDRKDYAGFHELARKISASRPGSWIVLFEPSGQIVVNTARPHGAKLPNVFEQEARLPPLKEGELPRGGAGWVRKCFAAQGPVYTDLFQGLVTGTYGVGVSVPVVRGGRTVGCVTIAMPTTSLQRLLESQPRSEGAGAVIFDNAGFIIARAARAPEFVGRQAPADAREAVRERTEAVGGGLNSAGERVFRASVRSPLSGWTSSVTLSEQEAFGTILKSLREWAIAALIIVAIGTGVALGMGRVITRRREAESASRAKDQFIAAVSHELRNPLSAIAMSNELLKLRVAGDREAARAVDTVDRQITQLRRLLEDLLDTSRAMTGKLAIQPEPVDLLAAAREVAPEYQGRVRLELRGTPAWVHADPVRLHQMIGNLVENAAKYGARNVVLTVGIEGERARLSVADDGQGIEPALLGRLFEPFVQGEQSIERAQGGLGLGLALVRRLVALHHGSVTAESPGRGKGSTFTIYLPLSRPPAQQAADASTASGAASPRRRVLVVDDVADARESLRRLLELDGHQVVLAADGASALDKIRAFRPEVALIDIGLPGMDGYAVARAARASGPQPLLLVALTGYGRSEDRRSARDAGFDLHLTKPVSFEDLRKAIG